jgi:hypothetical protein
MGCNVVEPGYMKPVDYDSAEAGLKAADPRDRFQAVEELRLVCRYASLCKDAPEPRAKQPPDLGAVIEIAEIGGLHHRYERRAA